MTDMIEGIAAAIMAGSLDARWWCDSCGVSGFVLTPARGSHASKKRWLNVHRQRYIMAHDHAITWLEIGEVKPN